MILEHLTDCAIVAAVVAVLVNGWSALVEGPASKKSERRILG